MGLQDGSDGTGVISISILENEKKRRDEEAKIVSFKEFYLPERSPESLPGQLEELYPSTKRHIISTRRISMVAEAADDQDNYLYYKTFGEWDERVIRSDRNSHFKQRAVYVELGDSVESRTSNSERHASVAGSRRNMTAPPIARAKPCDQQATGAEDCDAMVQPGSNTCDANHTQ